MKLFDAGTGGMEILFQARGARKLVIVDACTSGSEPGAIFEVPGQELEGPPKQASICMISAGIMRFMRDAASSPINFRTR